MSYQKKFILCFCVLIASCSQNEKRSTGSAGQNYVTSQGGIRAASTERDFDGMQGADSSSGPGDADQDMGQDTGSGIESLPEKINPSSLKVYNLTVGNMRQASSLGQSLSFEVSGSADYIFWKFCPQEKTDQKCPENRECSEGGECIQNVTVYNRVTVPPLYAGDIFVSVRGCLEPEHSLNTKEPCGPWEVVRYNSKKSNDKVIALLNEKDKIIHDLGEIQRERLYVYRDFSQEGRECLKTNAKSVANLESRIRLAEEFLKAPVTWVVQAAKDVGYAIFQDPGVTVAHGLMRWGIALRKALGKTCDQTLGTSICGVFGSIAHFGNSMIDGFNPIHSIYKLQDAIHVLSDTENSVAKACHAEEKLAKREEQMDHQIKIKITRLQEIKQALMSMGEYKSDAMP